MALPKIATPIYETTLPVTGQDIRFRPWLVGDKKALLVAVQSNDKAMVRNTVFDVVRRCVLSEDLDFDNLPATDLAWITLKLRTYSDSNVLDLSLRVNDCTTKDICQQQIKLSLDDVEVYNHPDHTEKIQLTDQIGVIMRQPTLAQAQAYFALSDNPDKEQAVETYFDTVAMCIAKIYDLEQVFDTKDSSAEELREFLSCLTDEQFTKLTRFFDTMPQLYKKINFTCKTCGRNLEYELKGINDFLE